MNQSFLLAIGIGVVAGLRSFTAPAAISWGAAAGWLQLQGSRLAFMGSTIAVTILSLLAIGELVGDKLPITPKRTALAPLLTRIVTGSLGGACLCLSARESLAVGALLGGAGAVGGAFGGYEARRRLVGNFHLDGFLVASVEDLIAIGLAWFCIFFAR